MGIENRSRLRVTMIEVAFQGTLIEHAGRDDVHEQRELDQLVEGIIHVAAEPLDRAGGAR